MMAKFPRNLWDFWRMLDNFLGNSMVLLDQCRIFPGIYSIFKDLVKQVGWMMAKFPRNLWDFWRMLDSFPRKFHDFA